MDLKEFDYTLPPELIAQHPIAQRDHSRLMVLNRHHHTIEHRIFFEIVDYCNPGDVLVVNDTKVIPARLRGTKESGGNIELLLLRPEHNGTVDETIWHCLVNCHKKPKPRSTILFGNALTAEILEGGTEQCKVKFYYDGPFEKVLAQIGTTPLPPYIKRENRTRYDEATDRERYQTIFARVQGAVAAPTAGLHFTSNLLNQLHERGVTLLSVTLHVGWGTFAPVKAEEIAKHRMHEEYIEIRKEVVERILQAKSEGRRVIAVGTTSVRCFRIKNLELRIKDKKKRAKVRERKFQIPDSGFRAFTDIFIHPGYKFQVVDAMITNFHLPKSTLLMLVSAFAEKDLIDKAYSEAIAKQYRFYSYGDAMLIL